MFKVYSNQKLKTVNCKSIKYVDNILDKKIGIFFIVIVGVIICDA